MYVPQAFRESDPKQLAEFVRCHPLATLIRLEEGELCADHIPMLLFEQSSGGAVLRGHVARANPLWRSLGAGASVLAIFQDPGCYITPSWYASKAESGKVVPTWNYVAVHVSGRALAVDEPQWLHSFLERLTASQEGTHAAAWKVTDAPSDYVAAQLRAIVGIELRIERMVGKWKVSQNRLGKDLDGVLAGLHARGDETSHAMAELVEARRPR